MQGVIMVCIALGVMVTAPLWLAVLGAIAAAFGII